MLTDILSHYGFSDKEAKLYLTSLEIGKSPASTLARKTEIKRVTTYSILKDMEKKWWMQSEEIWGITYFCSTHPETLLRHLREKISDFEQHLDQFLSLAHTFAEVKGDIPVESKRRDPLHTQGLQQKFPQVYSTFWKNHQHIFSGNSVLTRWGGLGISGAFNIKQKLPSKIYLGISPMKTVDIQFVTSTEYDVTRDSFDDIDISADTRFTALKEYILDFLKKQKYTSGLKISLLVESPQGLGTGYLSVSMSLLAYALYALTGKVEKKFLKNYDSFLQSDTFLEVINFSKNLVDIPTNGNTHGANNYLVFSNTNKPQIYNKLSVTPLRFIAKSLEEFFSIEPQHTASILPFDYGYFFLGSGYNSNMIISMKSNVKKVLTSDKKHLIERYLENGISKVEIKQIFGSLLDNDFYQELQNVFLILKAKLLLAFEKVLCFPHDDGQLSNFIQTINIYNQYAGVAEPENPLLNLIKEKFDHYKYFKDEELGIFPIASWKYGGCFGFVMKYQKSRETLKQVFDSLKAEGHSKISLPYASRIDGNSSDGVKQEK